jgi:N-acetylmuramoyl-L-alanine amidase
MLLRKGTKNNDVKVLQEMLGIAQDGVFGAYTELAVKEFQRQHGLTADGVVGTKTWEALCKEYGKLNIVLKKSRRIITEIIVHCSATPEGRDYTVADITSWHKQRGFTTIGYHYVVYRDGTIHEGRSVDSIGAHCTSHNANSIGVCYIGGMDRANKVEKDTRTAAQKETLLKLMNELKRLYPRAKIHGHRDFANKACPSFDATREYGVI